MNPNDELQRKIDELTDYAKKHSIPLEDIVSCAAKNFDSASRESIGNAAKALQRLVIPPSHNVLDQPPAYLLVPRENGDTLYRLCMPGERADVLLERFREVSWPERHYPYRALTPKERFELVVAEEVEERMPGAKCTFEYGVDADDQQSVWVHVYIGKIDAAKASKVRSDVRDAFFASGLNRGDSSRVVHNVFTRFRNAV